MRLFHSNEHYTFFNSFYYIHNKILIHFSQFERFLESPHAFVMVKQLKKYQKGTIRVYKKYACIAEILEVFTYTKILKIQLLSTH